MGYLFTGKSKEQCINGIKRDYPTMIEWSLAGNQLWGLYPVEIDKDTVKKGDSVIILFLLSSYNNEWGYKVMDESAHPYYYKCPLKFLKKSVVLNQEWRDTVIKHHSDKSERVRAVKTIKVGDTIELINSSVKSVLVQSINPFRGTDVATGVLYRIPKTMIKI